MENQNSPSEDRLVSGQPAHRPRSIGLKPLGEYLVEAGLLAPAQVAVALNDQTVTGLRFGEILAKRGWVREQTIEYLMDKVIEPERRSLRYSMAATQRMNTSAKTAASATSPHRKGFVRSTPAAEPSKRPPAPPSAKMPIAVSQPVSSFRSDDASLRHRKHYGPTNPGGAALSMTPPPPPPPSYPPPPPPEDRPRDEDESPAITTCNGVSASDDFREASENLVWIG